MIDERVIVLNGEVTRVDAGTLAELIEEKHIDASKVAMEVNRTIIPKDKYAETTLEVGDEIEVVEFIGGG